MRVESSILHLVLGLLNVAACWELSLLHVNDIHSRMEETNKYSSKCTDKDKAKGKCYGGLARMYTAVKDIRSKEDNVIWLNAGDFYQVCEKLSVKENQIIYQFLPRVLCGTPSSNGI